MSLVEEKIIFSRPIFTFSKHPRESLVEVGVNSTDAEEEAITLVGEALLNVGSISGVGDGSFVNNAPLHPVVNKNRRTIILLFCRGRNKFD